MIPNYSIGKKLKPTEILRTYKPFSEKIKKMEKHFIRPRNLPEYFIYFPTNILNILKSLNITFSPHFVSKWRKKLIRS